MVELRVRGLTLEYPISRRYAPNTKGTGSTPLIGSLVGRRDGATVVRALKRVSFELAEGDRLALVGRNGAGKSSLLMALAGIYEPKRGRVISKGNVHALLNVRLGFRLEATGRRNIILRGLLLGASRSEIEKHMDDIIAFSELEDYIDLPLYTYSQGMAARLAFAVATSWVPDILLLDEGFGAADRAFQKKSRQRLEEIISAAGIVVIASHNETILRSICNKALLLKRGRVEKFGPLREVLKALH